VVGIVDGAPNKVVRKFMESNVETGTYSAESLERALLALQDRYGMDSESFLRAHRADDPLVRDVPGFLRHTWASYYTEWRELTAAELHASPREDVLAGHIRRELEHA
jgi:hypothetical protein